MKTTILVTALILALASGALAASTVLGASTIRGRVMDLNGDPLPAATIQIIPSDGMSRATTTSSDGEYTTGKIAPGKVALVFLSAGFRRESVELYLNEGEEVVFDIGLEVGLTAAVPSTRIQGIVLDEVGKPIGAATVTIMSAFNPRLKDITRTNGSGRFEFDLTFSGQFIIFVAKPAFDVSTMSLRFLPTLKPKDLPFSVVMVRTKEH